MPKTKEELRDEWTRMIDNDITIESRKNGLNAKYKINDLNDEIEVIFKKEGRREEEELIEELDKFQKENPDIIKEIQDAKAAREEQLNKEIEEELHRERPDLFPTEEEKRQREEEENEKDRKLREGIEKAIAEAELIQQGIFFTGEEAQKREQQRIEAEAKKLEEQALKAAMDEMIAEDSAKYKYERRQYVREMNRMDKSAIHDLSIIKKNYRKDIDLSSISDEELSEAEKYYDSILGNIPGDKEINYSKFVFYPTTGYKASSCSVSEYVDDFIAKQAETKSPKEVNALAEKRDALIKVTLLHAMAERTFMLTFRDEDDTLFIDQPELTSPQLRYYVDYIHNNDQPPVYKEAEPEAKPEEPAPEEVKQENVAPEVKPEEVKQEAKPEEVKTEAKPEVKPEVKNNEPEISAENKASLTNGLNEAWLKLKTYQHIKEKIAMKLASFDMVLQMEQENCKNFEDIQKLAKAVKHAIDISCDPNKTPDDVKKALKSCIPAANKVLSESKFGLYEMPKSIAEVANNISNELPADYYKLSLAEINMESDVLSTKGLSEKSIEEIYREYSKTLNVDLNTNDISKYDLAGKEACINVSAGYQREFLRELNKQHKVSINLANYKQPDKIIQSSKDPSTYELAGNFLATSKIVEMLKISSATPGGFVESQNLLNDLKKGPSLKSQIKNLSNDKVFQYVAKKNKNNIYTTWNNVLSNADKMMKDKTNYFRKFHNPDKLTSYDVNYELQKMKGTPEQNGIEFVSTFLTNQIIANPNNSKIRNAIVTGMLSEEGIKNSIAQDLIKNNTLKKQISGATLTDTIKVKLNNKSLQNDIIKNVIKNAKPKAPTTDNKKQRTTQTKKTNQDEKKMSGPKH